MQKLVVYTLFICSVTLSIALYSVIKARTPYSYGVYESGSSDDLVINYRAGRLAPVLSHPISTEHSLLLTTEGNGEAFNTWRRPDSCGMQTQAGFGFVLPRRQKVVIGQATYLRREPPSVYSLINGKKENFVIVDEFIDGKRTRSYEYDDLIGVRNYASYLPDGKLGAQEYLSKGSGALRHCAGKSLRDVINLPD